MFEYIRRENRYIEFESPTGGYQKIELDYSDVWVILLEEIDKKFIIIKVFDKQTSRFEKIISNVELELIEAIPNMDTYKLKDRPSSSDDRNFTVD